MRRLKKIDDDWLNGESVSEKIVDNGITSFTDRELLKMVTIPLCFQILWLEILLMFLIDALILMTHFQNYPQLKG